MPHREKCLESIHVHTGESLKRDLQDLAIVENRPVGEFIRAVLEHYVYGAKAKLHLINPSEQAQ